MSRRATLLAFSAAVLLQALIVALVPAGKYVALSSGQPLLLKLAPVDPYSMMSGYYADLSFEVSRLDFFKDPPALEPGQTVYALVEKGQDGAWHPVSLSLAKPFGLLPQQAFLRGTWGTSRGGRITYGIEAFFIPEEDREELDKAMGLRWDWRPPPPPPKVGPPAPEPARPPPPPSYAEVKVDSGGRVALVALRVGDRRFKG